MQFLKRAQLLACVVVLSGCDNLFVTEPARNPEAVFENFWSTYKAEYAGFAARGVDWDSMYARHRSRVTATTTDEALFEVLAALLTPLDDSHVSLTAPRQTMFMSSRLHREEIDAELFDVDVVRSNYLEPGVVAGARNAYVYGKLKSANLAYIFFKNIEPDFAMFGRMLMDYADADGYLVDLRRNGGGNHTFAFEQIARLTNQKRYVFRSRTKNGPGANDYTPWYEWHIKPAGTFVDKPIAVLVDRYTPSAAERAVMAFKTLPQVTIVGDTTNGATSTKIGRELANAWYYTLSPQQVEMYDGRSYEGRGIAPDLFVKNHVDEMRVGVDRVLQTAIDRLR